MTHGKWGVVAVCGAVLVAAPLMAAEQSVGTSLFGANEVGHDGAGEDAASEKHLGYFHPATLAAWAPARSTLTEGYPGSPPPGFSLVRRWDGYCVLERSDSVWQVATITVDGAGVLAGKDRNSRLSTTNDAVDHGHVVGAVSGILVGLGLGDVVILLSLILIGLRDPLYSGLRPFRRSGGPGSRRSG